MLFDDLLPSRQTIASAHEEIMPDRDNWRIRKGLGCIFPTACQPKRKVQLAAMNGTELLEKLDLPAAFSEATADAFKAGIGELTKEEIARHGVSVLWPVLASEGAKAIVGTVAGPL